VQGEQPSADQYSAAATLYYLLTGAFAYELPRDVPKQLLMILQDSIVPLEKRRTDLPASLVKVIHKALSRDPSARYSSANEFGAALRPFAPSMRPKQKSE
jgi:serine/threonine protein kinase